MPAPTGLPNGALLDQFGNLLNDAFKAPSDPLNEDSKYLAQAVYRDVPVYSTFVEDWTIGRIRQALKAHDDGNFWMSAQLADALYADDRVQATLQSRTAGLFAQALKHKLRVDTPKARKCRKAWKAAFPKMLPNSVASEIVRWMGIMGFCLCEIVWDQSVRPWQPYLKIWPPHLIYYLMPVRKYAVMTQDGMEYVTPGNSKWVLFAPHGAYRGWLQGAIRSISSKILLKELAWNAWARFSERHGLPVMLAGIPAAGDPQQKANFIASLRSMNQQAVVGLPQNVDGTAYTLSLMEARDRAYGTFTDTINMVNQAIAIVILGQDMTTQMPEGGGSYAAARVHGGIRQNFLEFDNQLISETLYEQAARPFAYFNFDDADAATFSTWDVDPPEDFATRADTFLKVGQGVNYFRQAGFGFDDIVKLTKQFGIKTGKVSPVNPVQVEARLAGATGDVDSDPGTARLQAQVTKLQREIEDIDRRFVARAA